MFKAGDGTDYEFHSLIAAIAARIVCLPCQASSFQLVMATEVVSRARRRSWRSCYALRDDRQSVLVLTGRNSIAGACASLGLGSKG